MSKRLLPVLVVAFLAIGCDNKDAAQTTNNSTVQPAAKAPAAKAPAAKAPAGGSKVDISKAYMDDLGIGPIKTVALGAIDDTLAAKGREVFKAKCTACHKFKKRYVGPALKGVTQRRSAPWIMNMMLNPEQMLADNALAKALLLEYSAPMANQGLTQDDARGVLEFFRSKDQ